MNLRAFLFLITGVLATGIPVFAQLVPVGDFSPRIADTIILDRNWRTHDKIILAELEFAAGDTITPEILGISLKKIWNLQNFATVDYRWDSLPDGRSALKLVTRDAITIVPIIGGNFQKEDIRITTGLADQNFLGRNFRLELRGQLSINEPWGGEIKFEVPRQLLWKNMSVGAGYKLWMFFRREAYDQLSIAIVNPFHQDYRNTFAPDFETGRLRNQSLLPNIGPSDPLPDWYYPHSRSFWYFRTSETIGTITHRRHQEEGYSITGSFGVSIGLNRESQNYIDAGLKAEYNRLLLPKLQFGAHWEGYYCSSNYESLWTRLGPGNIRGISYGDLTGPLMQLASIGLYYTWINLDYLAVEQSAFVQYASAMKIPGDWTSVKHEFAIGTGFQFTIPMYPAASLLLSFSYNPGYRNWFYLEL